MLVAKSNLSAPRLRTSMTLRRSGDVHHWPSRVHWKSSKDSSNGAVPGHRGASSSFLLNEQDTEFERAVSESIAPRASKLQVAQCANTKVCSLSSKEACPCAPRTRTCVNHPPNQRARPRTLATTRHDLELLASTAGFPRALPLYRELRGLVFPVGGVRRTHELQHH